MAEDNIDVLKRALAEKGFNSVCESCGKTDWAFLDSVLGLLHEEPTPGMYVMPIVAIECRNCGHIRFYSRDALGFKDPELEDK